MEKPKTAGTSDSPTLGGKKSVSEFTVTPDVQRIMGMKSDPDGFNPAVNPPITDAGARSYAARIQERAATKKTAASLKGKSPPLGHVESPSSEQMEKLAGLSSGAMPRPTFSEPPAPEAPAAQPPPQEQPPMAPTIRGVGAAYPVNQALVQGKTDGPVTLREGNKMAQQQPGALSKETVQALEMANENMKKSQAEKPREPEKVTPSVARDVKAELDEAERSLPGPADQLDYAAIEDIRGGLMSQKRREEIEARLTPLDIGDMVMKRELMQVVPVIPGKLELTLRTFSQRENLWILKYLYDFPGSSAYVQELLNTCRLVCGLVAINGAYLPDHRKDAGQSSEVVDKEAFEKKFFHVASFPVQLVADLSVQSIWFQDRVDKLFTVEALKNG